MWRVPLTNRSAGSAEVGMSRDSLPHLHLCQVPGERTCRVPVTRPAAGHLRDRLPGAAALEAAVENALFRPFLRQSSKAVSPSRESVLKAQGILNPPPPCSRETALPFIHPFDLIVENRGGRAVHAFQGMNRIRTWIAEFSCATSMIDYPLGSSLIQPR